MHIYFILFYSYFGKISEQPEVKWGGSFIVKDEGDSGNGRWGSDVCLCSPVACDLGLVSSLWLKSQKNTMDIKITTVQSPPR